VLEVHSHSVSDTREIAAVLSQLVAVNDIVLLHGDMGAGKTAFAQGFAAGLGIDEPVTSPTFNLVHTFDTGRIVLHHADLYRLDRTSEVSDLGLGELVEGDGVLIVEWGEAAAGLLGDHLDIRLEVARSNTGEATSEDERILRFEPCGESWVRRWSKIEAALAPWSSVGEPC